MSYRALQSYTQMKSDVSKMYFVLNVKNTKSCLNRLVLPKTIALLPILYNFLDRLFQYLFSTLSIYYLCTNKNSLLVVVFSKNSKNAKVWYFENVSCINLKFMKKKAE